MSDDKQDDPQHTTPTTEYPGKTRSRESKQKRKRLGTLATMFFIGMTGLSGGFIFGERYPKAQPPSPQPAFVLLVDSQREIRNLSDTLRHTLKMAAKKAITIDDAVDQLADTLQIRLSDTGLREQIRRIVQRGVEASTDDSVQEGFDALVDLLKQISKPSPSPSPTATIVFPRPK